jgi:hypothetical protein
MAERMGCLILLSLWSYVTRNGSGQGHSTVKFPVRNEGGMVIYPFGFKIFTNKYNGAVDEVVAAGNNS